MNPGPDDRIPPLVILLLVFLLLWAALSRQEGGPDMYHYDGTPLSQTRVVENWPTGGRDE